MAHSASDMVRGRMRRTGTCPTLHSSEHIITLDSQTADQIIQGNLPRLAEPIARSIVWTAEMEFDRAASGVLLGSIGSAIPDPQA